MSRWNLFNPSRSDNSRFLQRLPCGLFQPRSRLSSMQSVYCRNVLQPIANLVAWVALPYRHFFPVSCCNHIFHMFDLPARSFLPSRRACLSGTLQSDGWHILHLVWIELQRFLHQRSMSSRLLLPPWSLKSLRMSRRILAGLQGCQIDRQLSALLCSGYLLPSCVRKNAAVSGRAVLYCW